MKKNPVKAILWDEWAKGRRESGDSCFCEIAERCDPVQNDRACFRCFDNAAKKRLTGKVVIE